MAILIGIDEAGLGPNLGPCVVTATVWEAPGKGHDCDLWQACADAVTSSPAAGDRRLHIGDSKAIFQPSKGVAALERGVLAALGLLPQGVPDTDRRLRSRLSLDGDDHTGADPWYEGDDLSLPTANDLDEIMESSAGWRTALERSGIRLREIRVAMVEPRRFNDLIEFHQNKAAALSAISLQVLKHVASRAGEQPVFVWCDKHGGRNRYDHLLSACFDDAFVFRLKESAELSTYRIGLMEIRFQPRAECHFPVALASMVSKYIRELSMHRFNRFWSEKIPGLKPTQGYSVDAYRFRAEIAAEQRRLDIPDHQLWRCR